MSPPSPDSCDDGDGRLNRCIRDLAALNALPSMCVGRSPAETLEIVLDALPTALDCELIYLRLPGPKERVSLGGASLSEPRLAEVAGVIASCGDDSEAL